MNGSFLKEDYNLTIVSPEAVVQSWALSYYPYIYDDLHQSTKLGICALTNTRYDIMGTKSPLSARYRRYFETFHGEVDESEKPSVRKLYTFQHFQPLGTQQ